MVNHALHIHVGNNGVTGEDVTTLAEIMGTSIVVGQVPAKPIGAEIVVNPALTTVTGGNK